MCWTVGTQELEKNISHQLLFGRIGVAQFLNSRCREYSLLYQMVNHWTLGIDIRNNQCKVVDNFMLDFRVRIVALKDNNIDLNADNGNF